MDVGHPIEMKKNKRTSGIMGYGSGNPFHTAFLNFADVEQLLAETEGFDFALADLGVSSMQIDNPERAIYL